MRYLLTYLDGAKEVSSVYNEQDLRDWLDAWPDYAQPTEINIKKLT